MKPAQLHIYLIAALNVFCGCKHSFIISAQEIRATKIGSRPLPASTVTVLDFDKVVVKENNRVLLADISDSTNTKIIYEAPLAINRMYHSVQLQRYFIFEDRTGEYSQSVLDMITGQLIDLREPVGTSGGASIAPNDGIILYNSRFPRPNKFGEQTLVNRMKSWDGQTETVVDSVIGTLWAPNGKWFLAAQRLGREGGFVLWERALFNREGKKILLPSETSQIAGAVWSENGSVLAIPHSGYAVTIVEFDWNNEVPIIKKHTTSSGFNSPLLWSPNGQYLIYVKYYEDGHTTFGNDILMTDRSLSMRQTIIAHNNIQETPITWNHPYGLVTRAGDRVFSYRIQL
jgi:hypothetical protein